MTKPLTAVVIGAGWAGEGHVLGLRSAGVTVTAICARKTEIVSAVAKNLGVPVASTNWRETLHELKPDIVTIATPAVLREEAILEAIALGAHIACEKPLALDAIVAKRIFNAAKKAGVKHAYATTQAFDPSVAWVSELVRTEDIGRIRSAELFGFFKLFDENMPWSWSDDVKSGGGGLYNGFTHFLAILAKIFGSHPSRVMGEVRAGRDNAPYVGDFHDHRQSRFASVDKDAAGIEMRPVDGDNAIHAILDFPLPGGDSVPCVVRLDAMMPFSPSYLYIRIFGEKGTIEAKGVFGYDISVLTPEGSIPKPMPERFLVGYPDTGDGEQNKWNVFFREFVSDIRGENHAYYATFHEGYLDLRIIDAIRSGRGWTNIFSK